MTIRPAHPDDADAIAAIYETHVRTGTASFDTEPRTPGETRIKIEANAAAGWPFLVAEIDGAIAGYAYANQFRDRPAYALTCENSIYIHPDRLGMGIGRQLLSALLVEAEACGFRQMIAVIGGGEPASVALHAGQGFTHAGRMQSVGRKFGRWLDTVYMQRALGVGDATAPGEEPR